MATWGPTAGQLRGTGPTCWTTGASRGLGRRLQFGENMSFAFMRWPTTAARRYKQREIDWFRRAEYEYVGTSASARARRRRPTSCRCSSSMLAQSVTKCQSKNHHQQQQQQENAQTLSTEQVPTVMVATVRIAAAAEIFVMGHIFVLFPHRAPYTLRWAVDRHSRRHLRSSSYRTLAVPRTRTTLGDKSFAVAGPHAWNSSPATMDGVFVFF